MKHEDYPMPQLSAQEKEAAFRRLLIKGANIKRRLAHFPNSEMLKLDLIGVQIALAALTARRKGFIEAKSSGTDSFILKGFYLHGLFIDDNIYTAPPVPVVKGYGWISCNERMPENENGKYSDPVIALADSGQAFTLSCMGNYWQRTRAFIDSGATKVTHWQPLVYPDKE